MSAFQLLAALVPVSAFALLVLAVTCIAAAIIFAPPAHYIAGNLHIFNPKHVFGLHVDVSGDPQTYIARKVWLGYFKHNNISLYNRGSVSSLIHDRD